MAKELELAQLIKGLRAELAKAQTEGEDKGIRFTVEDVELDLEISTAKQVNGDIGAKFYVLTSQFKANKKDAVTQKIKLKLKPQEEVVDPTSGEITTVPAKVGGKIKARC